MTMLDAVAKALTELAAKGETLISSDEKTGVYADEVKVYVENVLRGLKCDFHSNQWIVDVRIKITE